MSNDSLAGLAVACFRDSPRPSFRCSQNGPPVSAFDYLMCRFEQSSLIDGSGSVARDQNAIARSRAGAANLRNVLESMLDDIEATPLNSVADISVKWGDQLLKFNLNGLSVYQFVMQTLGECFSRVGQMND